MRTSVFATVATLGLTTGLAAQSSREVTLLTGDSVHISVTLTAPPARAPGQKVPAVVLVHQAGSTRAEWDPVVPLLVREGWVTLAYDIRGHGRSDRIDRPISALFNDPSLAPLDLEAALEYARGMEAVDPTRIAVVGASIGANLAAMSTSRFQAKTAVALSAKESAVFNLGGSNDLSLRSVFYIASEFEQDGARAAWAESLSNRTSAPIAVYIVEGSSGHGVSVFRDDPGVPRRIVEWLQATL